MLKYALIFLLLIAANLQGFGTGGTEGKNEVENLYWDNKKIEVYTPEVYEKKFPQNWAILQDKRGVILVGNMAGVLEFDGATWRRIRISGSTARSLAMAPDNTVYVGGRNEIGRLLPNRRGELEYFSLMNQLREKNEHLGLVQQILCTRDAVWFRSTYKILRLQKGEFSVWKTQKKGSAFSILFSWKGHIYCHQQEGPLMLVAGDTLRPAPGCPAAAKGSIKTVMAFDEERLLLGFRQKGFFLYDGQRTIPFKTTMDTYLKKSLLTHGIKLADGNFAAATRNGGVVIFQTDGHVKTVYNKATGGSNNVKYICQDRNGSIWTALDKGLARIDYTSPVFVFNEKHGLEGLVMCVVKHRTDLYAGTSAGLFRLNTGGPGERKHFTQMSGISGNCWALLSDRDRLLIASGDGLFTIDEQDKNKLRVIVPKIKHFALAASKNFPGRIWAVNRDEILALKRSPDHWQITLRIPLGRQSAFSIVETDSGNLWLGTLNKEVLKVDFDVPDAPHRITPYNRADGLPIGEIYVVHAVGKVRFTSPQGIFRFNRETGRFVKDEILGRIYAGGVRKSVYKLTADPNGNLWFVSAYRFYRCIPLGDGTYNVSQIYFPGISQSQGNGIAFFDGLTWFATFSGLVGYDAGAAAKVDYRRTFPLQLRKVGVEGEMPLYMGSPPAQGVTAEQPCILGYDKRNLQFEAALPFFLDKAGTRYRYKMEGFDGSWSGWTDVPFKYYTNLDSGSMTLRVQAKNLYGEGGEACFYFRLLPPWYSSWWAYGLYGGLLMLGVYWLVRWRSARLMREKIHLERIVKERTQQINKANSQLMRKTILLEKQSEQLKEMDQIKSRFFANISHEFRTPLTLILGPLEQLKDKCAEHSVKNTLSLIARNALRLLGLINQLLDLSKLENGKMKLQASPGNLAAFVKNLMEPFQPMAAQSKRRLTFSCDRENIPLYFDDEKLEKILVNLLSNAFKFTEEGGHIQVVLSEGEEVVTIAVRDNGVGIPVHQRAHIFERFFQAAVARENGGESGAKGTGIGLSLTRELVELHYGSISVHSSVEENHGSEFIVTLPKGKAHLKVSEIRSETPAMHQDETSGDTEEEIPDEARKETAQAAQEAETTEITGKPEYMQYPETTKTTKTAIPGEPAETTEAAEAAGEEDKKDIVLVVEDNRDLRQYIRSALEPRYRVEEAANGKDGLRIAVKLVPDLVVSDVMMPQMDGFELCRTLKTDISTSHIPIVLLTARASEDYIVQGLQTGADDYITKPFNPRILEARIKNLIDLRRQLQLSINREMVSKPSRMAVSDIDREFLKDLKEAIAKNMSDPEFNVEQLSKELYMSRTSVYRKIQALSGETPTDFIRLCRLKHAAELLRTNYGSVTEVAFEVGFSSRAYFTKCFKENFHQLPSEYAQAMESASNE